jgi:hypothetical protein
VRAMDSVSMSASNWPVVGGGWSPGLKRSCSSLLLPVRYPDRLPCFSTLIVDSVGFFIDAYDL